MSPSGTFRSSLSKQEFIIFIAFEGPDNVGKSTSAASLSYDGKPIYNATKEAHSDLKEELGLEERDLVVTYDRIDWFSHMVYRLALPDREWNDARPRTVFAMPDTHLVIKLHHPDLADFTADEVVDTPIAKVNPMYYYFGDYFMHLNEQQDFALFKTVSLVEVRNNVADGTYSQRLVQFSSPAFEFGSVAERLVTDDDSLLELLRHEEHQRV